MGAEVAVATRVGRGVACDFVDTTLGDGKRLVAHALQLCVHVIRRGGHGD